jgi:DGQHR domain-containing protein
MATSIPTIKKIDSTQTMSVLFGVFDLSAYRVPFMSSVLSLRNVAEWFSLVTDNPKYAKQDWTVEELFQREVDLERARSIATIYLAPQASRPQFFNSLTVVLLPTEGVPTPELEVKSDHLLSIGPIAISYSESDPGGAYPAGGAVGTVRWNRNGVNAVAIDGQHRLAALKDLNAARPELANSAFVSVIFLILDKRFGFTQPGVGDVDSLKAMRSLFTDLNKHAVPVSRARNLLLDDHDPSARFVRALFGRHLRTELSSEVTNAYGHKVGLEGELREILPLNMVDWHGETKSKIDRGPYVASVLSLDWIVQRIVSNKRLFSQSIPMIVSPDPEEDGDPYEVLSGTLAKSWPLTWKSDVLKLKERIDQAKKSEQAFHLTIGDVDSLAGEFALKWSRAVTRMLVGLPGYRIVASERAATLTPEFAQWFQAREAWQNASDQRIKEYYKQRLDSVVKELDEKGSVAAEFKKCVERIESIKKDNVLFFLVGQRSVFAALFNLCESQKGPTWFKHIKTIHKELKLDDFIRCWQDFFAFMIVEALSDLSKNAPNLLLIPFSVKAGSKRLKDLASASVFWGGSIVKREDPAQVDFSGKAAERGARAILVIVFLYWWLKTNNKTDTQDIKKTIAAMRAGTGDLSASFSGELVLSINAFVGKDDAEVMDYSSPMHFLTKQILNWDQSLSEAAAWTRIEAVIEAYLIKA